MFHPWRELVAALAAGRRRSDGLPRHYCRICLAGDTARAATSDEVHDLRREATALKEVVADLTLENRLLTLLRVGSLGVSPAQGPRPYHQSGLHRDEGRRRVQGQDDGAGLSPNLACR